MTDLVQQLDREKDRLFRVSRSGISLPVAGVIYWLMLGILGLVLTERNWCLAAFYTSGVIFPLGIALQKPLSARLFEPSAFRSLFPIAMIPIGLSFAVTIPAFLEAPSLVPLALAVGMTVHWPVIGWIYGRSLFIWHAVGRTIVVAAIWAAMPESRFTAIPFAVSAVYAATVVWILIELRRDGDSD